MHFGKIMNILVVSSLTGYHYPDRFVGGIERCSEQMTQLISEMGHNVMLYGNAHDDLNKPFRFIKANPHSDVSAVKRRKLSVHDISVIIATNEIDVMICNSAKMWSWSEDIQKVFPKLRIVHIEHMSSEFFGLNRYGHFAKMCNAHKLGQKIFMSAKQMMPEWPLAIRNRHDVIVGKNGLSLQDIKAFTNTDGYYMAATATVEDVKPSNGRAIFIGRASVHKRPEFAAKILNSLGVKCDFYLATNSHDDESQKIIDKLRKIEEDGNIKLHLDRPYAEIMDSLRVAKFLFCSGLDTFCLVGFEAANFGVPTLFAIKNNLRSGIEMRYDYLSAYNDHVVDVFKKSNAEIAELIGKEITKIDDSMTVRKAIADDLYSRYNVEECKKNMNLIIGLNDQ